MQFLHRQLSRQRSYFPLQINRTAPFLGLVVLYDYYRIALHIHTINFVIIYEALGVLQTKYKILPIVGVICSSPGQNNCLVLEERNPLALHSIVHYKGQKVAYFRMDYYHNSWVVRSLFACQFSPAFSRSMSLEKRSSFYFRMDFSLMSRVSSSETSWFRCLSKI